MTEQNQLERLNFLRAEINRHDRLYYVEARPEIGDADYDALYREMLAIERDHPGWVTPDSPSQRVSGEPVSGFKQVRHDPPMRSLDKTHSKSDLVDFDTFLRKQMPGEVWDYVVEPKVDGVSLSLLYLGGRLTRAATRGNGDVGDDVTANIKTIRSVPLSIPDAPPILEVRGEVYMTRTGFVELNRREEEAGREPFANPRNAAAGSLKQLDPREAARRPLDVVIYAAGKISGRVFPTHSQMIETFRQWGFKTPPWQRLCIDMAHVLAAIDELQKLRHSFPFEIDGAVVKVNRRDLYDRLGMTAHAPRWARAFKYEPERAETRVNAVTVQVGRTGVLTPVAELEPVQLAGSTISRATLHNADEIARKDIRIGDRVWLVKAGDVIPAIESVLADKRTGGERPFQMPGLCPACGAPVARLPGEVASRCTNPACPAQRVGRLEHFASRDALDIKAVGDKVAEALVDQGLVQDPLDLFSLTPDKLAGFCIGDDASGFRKFGKNAQTMLAALQAAKALPLDRWLFATGIPDIGVTVAEQVAAAHPSFSSLPGSPVIDAVLKLADLADQASDANPRSTLSRPKDEDERLSRQTRYNRLCGEIGMYGDMLVDAGCATKIPGTALPPQYICTIKPEAAKSIRAFFDSDYGKNYLARLLALGIDPRRKEQPPANGPLKGETFVLTGTLSKPRSVFADRIKAAGGTVQDTVTRRTRYLVAGENTGEAKTSKARALGTEVIDEAGLEKLLGGTPPPPPAPPAPPPPPAAPAPPPPPKPAVYEQQELF
jgi:DNA ligase (NAD+)